MMEDTSGESLEKMREMIVKKTSQERFMMGASMFDFAKRLVVQSILNQQPSLSPSSLRREIFLRFYGKDFDSITQHKIIQHLVK